VIRVISVLVARLIGLGKAKLAQRGAGAAALLCYDAA
jgi:hypothetical protein